MCIGRCTETSRQNVACPSSCRVKIKYDELREHKACPYPHKVGRWVRFPPQPPSRSNRVKPTRMRLHTKSLLPTLGSSLHSRSLYVGIDPRLLTAPSQVRFLVREPTDDIHPRASKPRTGKSLSSAFNDPKCYWLHTSLLRRPVRVRIPLDRLRRK